MPRVNIGARPYFSLLAADMHDLYTVNLSIHWLYTCTQAAGKYITHILISKCHLALSFMLAMPNQRLYKAGLMPVLLMYVNFSHIPRPRTL